MQIDQMQLTSKPFNKSTCGQWRYLRPLAKYGTRIVENCHHHFRLL